MAMVKMISTTPLSLSSALGTSRLMSTSPLREW